MFSVGDHLVGWANSSIRHPDELPVISPEIKLHGIVREDPLECALYSKHAAELSDSVHAQAGPTANVNYPARDNAATHNKKSAQRSSCQESGEGVGMDSKTQQAEDTVSSSANALQVLKRLQSLPWRRIDVSFQHSRLPFFAHNNIQVTRRWLNWEGSAVCQHLAMQFADMEKNERIQNLISRT